MRLIIEHLKKESEQTESTLNSLRNSYFEIKGITCNSELSHSKN